MGLFDTHIHRHENVPYAKNVTINEHKAPTDESVKLLRELEKEAEKRVLEVISVDNNVMKACIIMWQEKINAGMKNDKVYHLKFNLNGKEYFIKDIMVTYGDYSGIKNYPHTHNSILQAVYKAFASVIAYEMIQQDPEFKNK